MGNDATGILTCEELLREIESRNISEINRLNYMATMWEWGYLDEDKWNTLTEDEKNLGQSLRQLFTPTYEGEDRTVILKALYFRFIKEPAMFVAFPKAAERNVKKVLDELSVVQIKELSKDLSPYHLVELFNISEKFKGQCKQSLKDLKMSHKLGKVECIERGECNKSKRTFLERRVNAYNFKQEKNFVKPFVRFRCIESGACFGLTIHWLADRGFHSELMRSTKNAKGDILHPTIKSLVNSHIAQRSFKSCLEEKLEKIETFDLPESEESMLSYFYNHVQQNHEDSKILLSIKQNNSAPTGHSLGLKVYTKDKRSFGKLTKKIVFEFYDSNFGKSKKSLDLSDFYDESKRKAIGEWFMTGLKKADAKTVRFYPVDSHSIKNYISQASGSEKSHQAIKDSFFRAMDDFNGIRAVGEHSSIKIR